MKSHNFPFLIFNAVNTAPNYTKKNYIAIWRNKVLILFKIVEIGFYLRPLLKRYWILRWLFLIDSFY